MSVLSAVPQSWRRLVFLGPTVMLSLLVVATLWDGPLPRPTIPSVIFHVDRPSSSSPPPSHSSSPHTTELINPNDIPSLLRALWASRLLPITAPNFTTLDGTLKTLPPPSELIHTQPLGKRICILDVDTRPLDEEGDIFFSPPSSSSSSSPGGPSWSSWSKIHPRTAGFLSHFLYATIHNYTYRFVRAPRYADRAPHWSKVIFTQELLRTHDVVVTLDYDAMFPSPEVPIEWLLNYWRVDEEVLVAMAADPDREHNLDATRKRVNVNTGFIISRAGERTQRLFKDWAECPDETRYKGCAVWKERAFHEQAAFSSHVRYDFLEEGFSVDFEGEGQGQGQGQGGGGDNVTTTTTTAAADGGRVGAGRGNGRGGDGRKYIKVLPCQEANGVPEVKESEGCEGQLVRHYWGAKKLPSREFESNVMSWMTPLLAGVAYGGTHPAVVMDFREKVLKGDRILDKVEEKPSGGP